MANYKHYFNNNFSGCVLVATKYDQNRDRDVRLYLMPGIADALGMNDGVDKWIAPLESPFLESVFKAIKSHWAGEIVKFPVVLSQRPAPGGAPRRKLLDEAPATKLTPRPRKALVDEPSQPQTPPRRRALLTD